MSQAIPAISIIIPVFNDRHFLEHLLTKLINSSIESTEIVIVDSSDDPKDYDITNFLEKNSEVSILYLRLPPSYAGKSLNLGVNRSSGRLIGFIDTKTYPQGDWPYSSIQHIKDKNLDVLFGLTTYEAESNYQKALKATSHGSVGHESVPGTVVSRESFVNNKGFVENIRAAYDIEWRERIKESTTWDVCKSPSCSYASLPTSFIETVKKYFVYSFHTALVQVNNNLKEVYLSLALILSALIFPRWNFLIGGWDNNPFYIADVTKIYLISLVFLGLLLILINRLLPKRQSGEIFQVTVKYLLLFFSVFCVYRWNGVVVDWVETASLYIPHITKTYITIICLISIIYRGLVLPLRRKEKREFIFPFRWVKVGFLGFILDLVKAPGYILGAFIALLRGF